MGTYLTTLENKRIPITDKQALSIRDTWILRDKPDTDQTKLEFLSTIASINYAPETIYCFHRFKVHKTIVNNHSNKIYIKKCKQCDKTFTTDER